MRRPLPIFLLVAVCAVPPLAGQQAAKPVVAVLSFRAVEVSAAVARSVSVLLETALVNTKACTVVSQSDRDRVLQAQEAALADCTDKECAVRIGKLLSATQIVVGEVVGLGKKIIVNAKIIDINTAEILAADTRSALAEEELEQLCRRLTRTLTEGILPEVAAQLPSEPEEKGAAVTGTEGTAATEPAGAAAAAAAPPEAIRNRQAFWLTHAGLLAQQAGNLASAMGFELLLYSDKMYQRYMEAASDWDAFFGDYQAAHAGYLTLEITSYAGWSLGTGAMAFSLFRFPGQDYALSRSGRALWTSGLILTVLGDALGLLAGNQSFNNRLLYDEYMNAASDFADFYSDYQTGYTFYVVSRSLNYAFLGLGAGALIGSYYLPGDKVPSINSPRDRWLLSGGFALISLGSVFQSMALHTRLLAEQRYSLYLSAAADFTELYKSYQSAYGQHVAYSVLAYSLWAGGGTAALLAMLPGRGKSAPAATGAHASVPQVAVAFLPAPGGLTMWVAARTMGF